MSENTSKTGEITMVTVFTLNDDTTEYEEFGEDFEALADVLRLQPGSLGSALGQSARNPRVYTNIGRWESSADYKAAVSGGDFFVHLSALYYLAQITSDETTNVVGGGEVLPDAAATAITTFVLRDADSAAEFESAFTEHAAFMAAQDGFVSYRLQKSGRRENTYVNIGQWSSPAAYLAVVQSPDFRADVARIGALADVESDLVHPYASSAAAPQRLAG